MENFSIYRFMKLGIVHFKAFPEVTLGEGPIVQTLRKIVEDDFFTAVEVGWMKDVKVRNEARRLLETSMMEVCYACQPRMFTNKLNINHFDPNERQKAISMMKNGIKEAYDLGASCARVFSGKHPGEEKKEEAKKIPGVAFLAQGTLYPDVGKPPRISLGSEAIQESRKDRRKLKSKSTPDDPFLRLKPLQPLRDLFKDEVKVVAKELGIPDSIIFRQPFPDTGLATRIIGEVTPLRLKVLREAQNCLVEEIKAAGIYEQVWQSFAILFPTGNIVAIRCIASTDGITAEWVRLPYEILDKVCRRILHRVKGVKRVVYDISSQPPSTIEWE